MNAPFHRPGLIRTALSTLLVSATLLGGCALDVEAPGSDPAELSGARQVVNPDHVARAIDPGSLAERVHIALDPQRATDLEVQLVEVMKDLREGTPLTRDAITLLTAVDFVLHREVAPRQRSRIETLAGYIEDAGLANPGVPAEPSRIDDLAMGHLLEELAEIAERAQRGDVSLRTRQLATIVLDILDDALTIRERRLAAQTAKAFNRFYAEDRPAIADVD